MAKLKKRHRPMTMLQWCVSAGGLTTIASMLDTDQDAVLRAVESSDNDDARFVAEQVNQGYHTYICAHIRHLLEQKP